MTRRAITSIFAPAALALVVGCSEGDKPPMTSPAPSGKMETGKRETGKMDGPMDKMASKGN